MQLSNHLIFDDLLKLAVCVLHPKKFFKRYHDGFKYHATQPSLSVSVNHYFHTLHPYCFADK